MSTGRVMAVYRRFFYSSIHSPPLLFDILLWPLLDLLIWGLLTRFIETSGTELPLPVGFLLGGVLIWDLLFRANQGISLAFLDDSAWSRNALNVFASPLRPLEYLAGATLWMLAKVAVGWSVMAIGAYLLFSFGILEIGWALIPFILAAMLFGVVMSLMVVGLILRFGNTAEIFAWGIAEIVSPLCAVYYPLSVLPGWAQVNRLVAAAVARVRGDARGAGREAPPGDEPRDRPHAGRRLPRGSLLLRERDAPPAPAPRPGDPLHVIPGMMSPWSSSGRAPVRPPVHVPNLWHSCVTTTVDEHLSRVPEAVGDLYRGFEAMVRACGPVEVVPVKTYISFMVRVRFAFAIPQQRALRLRLEGPRAIDPHGS